MLVSGGEGTPWCSLPNPATYPPVIANLDGKPWSSSGETAGAAPATSPSGDLDSGLLKCTRPCPLPRAPTASPHPRQLRALTAGRAGRALGLSGLCCPSAHAPCLSPSVGCPRPPHSSAAVPALDVEVATHSRGDAALASPRPRQKPLEGSRCSAAAPDA